MSVHYDKHDVFYVFLADNSIHAGSVDDQDWPRGVVSARSFPAVGCRRDWKGDVVPTHRTRGVEAAKRELEAFSRRTIFQVERPRCYGMLNGINKGDPPI